MTLKTTWTKASPSNGNVWILIDYHITVSDKVYSHRDDGATSVMYKT